MRSSAQVSEQATQASPSFPSASGRNPCGSRAAIMRSGVRMTSENAPRTLRDRLDDGVFDCGRARSRVKVQDDLGVARCLENRPQANEMIAQLLRVDQIAVVGDRNLPVHAVDQDRLRVVQLAVAGGGIAGVADRRRARQRGQPIRVEDIGDIAHVFRHDDAVPVGGGNAGALLTSMLHRIEAEIREVRRFGVPGNAEHRALVLELVEHRVTARHRPFAPSVSRRLACEVALERRRPDPVPRRRLSTSIDRPPSTRTAERPPPVVPMTAAGTPAAFAAASSTSTSAEAGRDDDARRRFAEKRRVDRPSTVRNPSPADGDIHLDADAVRVESALGQRHRQSALRTVVRR